MHGVSTDFFFHNRSIQSERQLGQRDNRGWLISVHSGSVLAAGPLLGVDVHAFVSTTNRRTCRIRPRELSLSSGYSGGKKEN